MVLVTTISGAFLQVSAWARQLDSPAVSSVRHVHHPPTVRERRTRGSPALPTGVGLLLCSGCAAFASPNPPACSAVRDALARSIATVYISLLGAAGLQDCADSGMDCMDGFGAFVLLNGGGFILALILDFPVSCRNGRCGFRVRASRCVARCRLLCRDLACAHRRVECMVCLPTLSPNLEEGRSGSSPLLDLNETGHFH